MARMVARGACNVATPDGTNYTFGTGKPVEVAEKHVGQILASRAGWYRVVAEDEPAPEDDERQGDERQAGGDSARPDDKWTLAQLQAEAARRGLPTSGTKNQLLERLARVSEPAPDPTPSALVNERLG